MVKEKKKKEEMEDNLITNSKENNNVSKNNIDRNELNEELVDKKKILDLKNKIKLLEDEKNELIDSIQRLQAEFDNYKKRINKEFLEQKEKGKAELIKKLLLIIDNFELALNKFNYDKNDNNILSKEFYKGVELIYAELISLLEDEGLKEIKDEDFNPYYHEVLLKVKGPKNKILEVLQKGYLFNNHLLRTAKVKVGDGTIKEPKDDVKK